MRVPLIVSFFSLVIFLGCDSPEKESSARTMNTPDEPIDTLLARALDRGDTSAYYDLKIAYLDYRTGEFLPIALIMANKNQYPNAYYDVYSTLCAIEGISASDSISEWQKWNASLRQMALDNLLKYAILVDTVRRADVLSDYKSDLPLGKLLRSDSVLVSRYRSLLSE